VPNSGWTTFHIRRKDQLQHAVWLMRLSYARFAIKKSKEPEKAFEQESLKLTLQEPFLSLLRKFVPRAAGEGGHLPESEASVATATRQAEVVRQEAGR